MATSISLKPLPVQVASLLNDCQKSLANHAKTAKALREQEKRDPKSFSTQFIAAVDRALVVPGKEPAVERFIKFIILYSCTSGSTLVERLLRHLVGASKVDDKIIRHRSCQVISAIILKLAESQEQLPENLLDVIKDALMVRTKDKSAAVRSEAAAGLAVFQDSRATDDIYDQFVRLLDDPQKEVRNAALSSIQLSMSTLGEVMKRSRDADENIRAETYKMIEQKVPFKRLSTEQRIDLLRSGLADTVERVRTACVQMVKNSWLVGCGGSISVLLSSLDVEEYEDVAEQVLRTLQDLTSTQAFGTKSTITAQEAMFWRVFAEQIKTCPAESRIDLEDLLPSMETMKMLLSKHRRDEFISKQLLITCANIDPGSDELGCRDLCLLLENWVYSVHLSEEMRILTCRALSALQDTDNYKRFMLRAIHEFTTENIDTISDTKATPDSPGWAQAITLVEELFSSSKDLPVNLVTEVCKNILVPLILLPDQGSANARNRGIKCLGLACTLSEKAVSAFAEIFVKASQNDILSIRQTSMKALFDVLMVWGTKAVAECSEDPLAYLATCLSPTTAEPLRRIAVEGFVKLMVSDTVRDEKILAQLFVLHFELRDERASIMKSCLQTFFDAYARWSHRNQNLITKAFVSTIHSIIRSAPGSKLKKVKPLEVTSFIASLTNPSLIEKVKKQSPTKITSYHNQLALAITVEVHTSQRVAEIEDMLRALPALILNKQDASPLLSLAGLIKSLLNRALSESVKKALRKTVAQLKELGIELPTEATPEPTNPRPVDRKRMLTLSAVVPKGDKEHLTSLDAFDLEEETPTKKRAAFAPGQKPCGNCKEVVAAWYCAQCCALWCNGCLDRDHSAPVFKRHAVTPYPASPCRPSSNATNKRVTIVETNSPELIMHHHEPSPKGCTTSALALHTPDAKKPRTNPALPVTKLQSVYSLQTCTVVSTSTPASAASMPGKRTLELDLSDESSAEQAEQQQQQQRRHVTPPPQQTQKRSRGETPAKTSTKPPPTPLWSTTPASQVLVSFSGFPDREQREEMSTMIKNLGGQAPMKDTMSLKATHLVVESEHRRLKTVIAAVLGMWIVSRKWVTDSAVVGKFLAEEKYGTMYCSKVHLAGKRFFLSSGFCRDPRFIPEEWQVLLVRVGEGRIVQHASSADYVLLTNGECVEGLSASTLACTWPTFMEMLQPTM